MSEIQAAVDAVTEQLDKAKGEILDQIEILEAAVAAGAVPDLSALKAAAQALDDIVPDEVVGVFGDPVVSDEVVVVPDEEPVV